MEKYASKHRAGEKPFPLDVAKQEWEAWQNVVGASKGIIPDDAGRMGWWAFENGDPCPGVPYVSAASISNTPLLHWLEAKLVEMGLR